MDKLKDVRLRLVKGAYKESEQVAYQSKEEIDQNFLKLAKKRLKGNAFTSIATHDNHIINELKQFAAKEDIDKNNFEFQMLYGFRVDMQEALANEGYRFCTYLPFGDDRSEERRVGKECRSRWGREFHIRRIMREIVYG